MISLCLALPGYRAEGLLSEPLKKKNQGKALEQQRRTTAALARGVSPGDRAGLASSGCSVSLEAVTAEAAGRGGQSQCLAHVPSLNKADANAPGQG